MKRKQAWIYGGLALVGVWLLTIGAIGWVRSQKVTAEKINLYMAAHPLRGKSEAERRRIVEGLAERVNRLPFDERQKFRFEHLRDQFYKEMTGAERAAYFDRTLPNGMREMMEAFNQMPPHQRKRLVDHAVRDLKRMQTDANREQMDELLADQNMKLLINGGMKNYLSTANAASKLDAQPLIEQIQNIAQENR